MIRDDHTQVYFYRVYFYRWWFAALLTMIVIMVFTLYDIYPLYQTWQDLHDEYRQSAEKWHDLEKMKGYPILSSRSPFTTASSMRVIFPLTIKILSSIAWQIKKLKVSKDSLPQSKTIQLLAQGSFSHLLEWLDLLKQYHLPVAITNFSYQLIAPQQFEFAMTILLVDLPYQEVNIRHDLPMTLRKESTSYLFCADANAMSFSHQEEKNLQTESLAMMKRVGSIRQGHHLQAFIQLPNHEVMAVKVGSKIGKERATLIAIQPQSLRLQLKNKQQIVLR